MEEKLVNKDIKEVLLSHEEILTITKKLGSLISADYKNSSKPILLGLLKGCVPFMSYLMNYLTFPLEIEFMDVSSYGNDIKSSGVVKIKKILMFLFLIEM